MTEYAGNYIYSGNDTAQTLQFFSTPEGYVTLDGMGGYDYVYQYRDHLGNIRLSYMDDPSNPGTPTIIEENNYYPFGLEHKGYNTGADNSLGNDFAQKWKFGGKEYEDGLYGVIATYDFGARNYDPALGRWMNLDPLVEMMRRHSPYNYAFNSPIIFFDPDGMGPFSTLVVENEDGTQTVVGGNANDGDNNIYIAEKNENGEYVSTGESIGKSLTSHSFFDNEENAVVGAKIDLNSTEGQDFIDNEIVDGDPSLVEYMPNATGGKKYDFKTRGIENREEGTTPDQFVYRGSVTKDGKIASARDFGNMGAGIIAARKGLSWGMSRLGFDGLETAQHSKFTPTVLPSGDIMYVPVINVETEGLTTQKAQKVGYNIGLKLRN